MPTNANTFNSRVTSEALEAKFRAVFPSQGGAELPQDLFASGVIQPVIDFSSVAEGSVLGNQLQTAWDVATGHNEIGAATTAIISNPGFWKIDLTCALGSGQTAVLFLSDGLTNKTIWRVRENSGTGAQFGLAEDSFVVFLRAGDTLSANNNDATRFLNVWYRQIADVYGNLVNPLGFTSS